MVLNNFEPELSYMLAELFNMCLKESCFPDCLKVSWVVLVFKNVGKGLQLNTTTLLVVFLWLVKFLKFVINKIIDRLDKCDLFSDI